MIDGRWSNMTGAEMITAWTLIEMLTSEEASSVTIINPNPDFDGPAFAIMVNADWTNYEDRRFEGDTCIACLDAANRVRVAST